MSELVSNVLDLTRFESGEVALRRDWQALDDLVGAAWQRHEAQLAEYPLELSLPADLPPVYVDAALIVQVFSNLFDNIAKYTPAGTRVRVSALPEGQLVRVYVDDEGPGLPPGESARLFDKFHRGIEEGTVAGVGLGLAICRAIIRAHGGSIEAEQRPGGGARFELTLPTLEFEAQNYRFAEASTAARAVIEARGRKPDIVLVDLGLPDGDGLGVIRQVRSWSALPIIVLSARTMEEQKIAAFDAGADDYVTKPFSAAELLARVRSALRRAARREDGSSALVLGSIRVDLARRESQGPDGYIHMTPLEYRVLECLAREAGLIVRQEQLIREVWGPDRLGDSRSLRVCIKNLRSKLEPDPRRPKYLQTEVGLGYRLRTDEPSSSGS